MTSRAHLDRLLTALKHADGQSWDDWRKASPTTNVDLRGADLYGLDLRGLDLRGADLAGARLDQAYLWNCRLDGANLRRATLRGAILNYAQLPGVHLEDANLIGATLTDADLEGAHLNRALLIGANLNGARLRGADLRGAAAMGASVWGIETDEKTRQSGLIIHLAWWDLGQWGDADAQEVRRYEHLTADDLETAHFITQIVHNPKLTQVINAATSLMVLLLGRFSRPRKQVLELMREKLLALGYAPVVFDFAQSPERDVIETVTGLAWLSRFVIADLTAPKSAPLEVHSIVPHLMVPFASIIQERERPFSLFADLQRKYDWVLPTVAYRDGAQLVRHLKKAVIEPAERIGRRLRARRTTILPIRSVAGGQRGRRRS